MNEASAIYVAGGSETMEGAALLRALQRDGYSRVIHDPEPDLRDDAAVRAFFEETSPEYVFLAAGDSGGIGINQTAPVDLMLDNLQVVQNVLSAAHRTEVKKLLYLAASCCYPRDADQPMRVDYLFTGPVEPTNEAYATAKLTGVKLCQAYRRQHGMNFIVGIPANPFGIGEDFSLENSHVIPALLRRMDEARTKGEPSVEVWGTGSPKREFIFADDLANACVFVMRKYDDTAPINLGSGEALSIRELAETVKEVVGYTGQLWFNTDKPDGAPMKMLDSSLLFSMGWRPQATLREAVVSLYDWFQSHEAETD